MAAEPCCKMRDKVHLLPALIPESVCGIPDSVIADFSTWNKSPCGRMEIAFAFCPWCGKPWVVTGETREYPAQDEESGEEWRKGRAPDEESGA